jgi:hypothetical protein
VTARTESLRVRAAALWPSGLAQEPRRLLPTRAGRRLVILRPAGVRVRVGGLPDKQQVGDASSGGSVSSRPGVLNRRCAGPPVVLHFPRRYVPEGASGC